MILAILDNQESRFDELIESVDIETRSDQGDTPVAVATVRVRLSMLTKLIAKGANVNAANSRDGATPLMYGAFKKDIDIIRVLISAGADVDALDYKGYLALGYFHGSYEECEKKVEPQIRKILQPSQKDNDDSNRLVARDTREYPNLYTPSKPTPGNCTYKGKEYYCQWWFNCETCFPNDEHSGVCVYCAERCQTEKHQLRIRYGPFFCDRGAQEQVNS